MILTFKKLFIILIFLFCSENVQMSEQTSSQNKMQKDIKYSKYDYSDEWKPNKLQIQDRFHPVTLHHTKQGTKYNQATILQSNLNNPNTQAVFLTPPQNNFQNNNVPTTETNVFQFDEVHESHAGEVIPGFVNQNSNFDIPSVNIVNVEDYIAFSQSSTTPSTTTSAVVNNTELKTVYVPWVYITSGPGNKLKNQDYRTLPTNEEGYPSRLESGYHIPKPTYLPPEPTYLPPAPTYLPPAPTYLPPKPTYLPPEPSFLPPQPHYLPPKMVESPYPPSNSYLPPSSYPPSGPYSYPKPPPPPPLPPDVVEKEKAAEFTYFFLGRKLWYIPLYFSIYFVLYVGYLVLKAIARHKILFPHLLHNAAVVSARNFQDENILYNFQDGGFKNIEELAKTVENALARINKI